MAEQHTMLKAMLRERHWQTYATFCREYDRAVTKIDNSLKGSYPSRGQFARWLAGHLKGLPHPDHCRVLVAMFPGLTAAQLFTLMGTATAAHTADLSYQPRSQNVAISASASPTPASTHDVPSGEDGDRETPSGEAGVLGEEIIMATEESARFVRRTRGAVNQDVLDQLNADVRQLAIDYLTHPPYEIFRPLARLRSEVFEMLEERQRPKVLPGLYRIGGQLCALLAHASADMGQAYAAETDTRAAWLCADLAEDDPLRAYVRWIQSNVAYWAGDYRRAAELAHSGQHYATVGTSLLRLASQEARAYAACHDQREVDRALATAAAARDQLGSDTMPGVFRFEPGKAAYYASEVHLALGGPDNYRRAAGSAEEALGILSAVAEMERCPEFIAAAHLDLAASHLALGDLDGASEHLRPVLKLPAESRTLPVVRRMTKVDGAISGPRFARTPVAVELTEQIALFCAYTARREPPQLSR